MPPYSYVSDTLVLRCYRVSSTAVPINTLFVFFSSLSSHYLCIVLHCTHTPRSNGEYSSHECTCQLKLKLPIATHSSQCLIHRLKLVFRVFIALTPLLFCAHIVLLTSLVESEVGAESESLEADAEAERALDIKFPAEIDALLRGVLCSQTSVRGGAARPPESAAHDNSF